MNSPNCPTLLVFCFLLGLAASAAAQEKEYEPLLWPSVRYGAPDKLSAGVAVQPRADGTFGRLIGTASIGLGGIKGGIGLGAFGGDLMTGYAVQITALRTTRHPLGALGGRTYVGLEAEIMLCNISVKLGPAILIGGAAPRGRLRFNWGIAYGF
jgi:hypothetical protein